MQALKAYLEQDKTLAPVLGAVYLDTPMQQAFPYITIAYKDGKDCTMLKQPQWKLCFALEIIARYGDLTAALHLMSLLNNSLKKAQYQITDATIIDQAVSWHATNKRDGLLVVQLEYQVFVRGKGEIK